MVKSSKLTVAIEPELLERVRKKSEETSTPYSAIVIRALTLWVETGKIPELVKEVKSKKE
jgi:hypothetical protein